MQPYQNTMAHGVPSIEEKAKRQQYLTPLVEICIFKCILLRNVPSRYIYTRSHGDAYEGIAATTPSCLSYLTGTYATGFIACRSLETTPFEEKALVKYLLRMSDNGYPVAVKYLHSLDFIIPRQRSTTAEAINPLGKNWPQAFHKRHPELKPKKVKAIDWNRHDRNIYNKITHWFEVIGKKLHDPIIAPENVFNMDETGVF